MRRRLDRMGDYRLRDGRYRHARFYAWEDVTGSSTVLSNTPPTTELVSVTTVKREYGVVPDTTFRIQGFVGTYVSWRAAAQDPHARTLQDRQTDRYDKLRAHIVADADDHPEWWSNEARTYVRTGRPALLTAVYEEKAAKARAHVAQTALRHYLVTTYAITDTHVCRADWGGVILRHPRTGSAWIWDHGTGRPRTYTYDTRLQKTVALHALATYGLSEDLRRAVWSAIKPRRSRPSWMGVYGCIK